MAVSDTAAQTPFTVERMRGAVELDGRVDEPAWESVDPVPLTMMMPTFRGAPSVRSEVRLAYDDDFLYLSGRLFDSPDSIQATSYKRDLLAPNIDYFGIFIDTFNDNETGFGFYTTPTGLRLDFSVADDAETGPGSQIPLNESWDTFWDAEVTRDDAGWYAEIRIPFSSLRFESGSRTEMGVIIQRRSARRNEQYSFPAINPTYGQWSWAKPSIAQPVTFEDVYSSRPVYVTPYALSGLNQQHVLNDAETRFRRDDDPDLDVGLDLKYGLTNNLTMDLTVNTDFAQVESDEQQVNFTRLPLFFPEKRRFFLERASIFEFNMGGRSRLFYSRRIGLHEGRIVPIIGGVKIAGRHEGWDVGLLNMHTAEAAGLPSENHGVVRFRRQTVNPYSYSGGVFTSRIGLDGSYNVALGTDHTWRVAGDDYLEFIAAQTFDDAFDNRPISLEQMRVIATWTRQTFSGLGYWFRYSRSGPRYRPELGFETRENYQYAGSRLGWGWLPGEGSYLQSHRFEWAAMGWFRLTDHSLESFFAGPSWEGTAKNGWMLNAQWRSSFEDLRAPLAFPGVVVPVGSYWFHGVELEMQAPGTRAVWGEGTLEVGSFYGGTRVSASVSPVWTLSRFFELQAYYEINRVDLGDGLPSALAHISRLRAQATFNTEWALSAFIQYNSDIDAVLTNIRLRFNPREGNDLYIVYNEGLNTDRRAYDPVPPLMSNRTVVAKYTYTFRW